MSLDDFFDKFSLLPFIFYLIFIPPCIFLWKRKNKKHDIGAIIFFFCSWVLACYYLIPHPIVMREDLSSLQSNSVILLHGKPLGKHINGYYFCNQDGIQDLSFDLCRADGIHKKDYLGKKVKIWHKDNWVYQMEYNGQIIFDIEKSNERTKYVIISNFNLFISWFFMFFMFYLSTIIEMSKCSSKKEVGK